MGHTVALPLVAFLNWTGAACVLVVLSVVASVATIGLNPLRPIGRGGVATARVLGGAARGAIAKRRGRMLRDAAEFFGLDGEEPPARPARARSTGAAGIAAPRAEPEPEVEPAGAPAGAPPEEAGGVATVLAAGKRVLDAARTKKGRRAAVEEGWCGWRSSAIRRPPTCRRSTC
jgi:hypothetical protein